MKVLSIDFEFKEHPTQRGYIVICACTKTDTEEEQWWLLDNPECQKALIEYIEFHRKGGYPINAHFAYAELTSLFSIGYLAEELEVIDTYVEAKLIQNHDRKDIKKDLSLSDLCLRYDIYDYAEYKDDMRSLILYNDCYTEQQQQQILEYCMIDTRNSHALLPELIKDHKRIYGSYPTRENILLRGATVKANAYASWKGILVDTELLNKIHDKYNTLVNSFVEESSDNVKDCYIVKGKYYSLNAKKLADKVYELGLDEKWKLTDTGAFTTSKDELKEFESLHPFVGELRETISKINSLKYLKPKDEIIVKEEMPDSWQEVVENPELFTASGAVSKKQFKEVMPTGWECNEKGQPKASYELFETYCVFTDSPDPVIVSIYRDLQIIKAYKEKQKKDLKGDEESTEVGEKETLYTAIREDRLHMPLGAFGTISSRSTPRARLFFFAQSAWTRCLAKVPKGYALVALDYSNQEILIGAGVYNDENMHTAFCSKDYYLYSGVLMEQVEAEDFDSMEVGELKNKYKDTRKLLKGLILGSNYGMGAAKLGRALYPELSQYRATTKATKLKKKYDKAFSSFVKNKAAYIRQSTEPQLWQHWGHIGLESGTTAGNWYIQTTGGLVLHKLYIKMSNPFLWQRGVEFATSLHDGIFMYLKEDDGKLQERIDWCIKTMCDTAREVVAPYFAEPPKIKVSYRVAHEGETFFEKSAAEVERIHTLVGHPINLMNDEEIEVLG